VSTGHPFVYPDEGTVEMIVIGADTHKRSHTAAAVIEATGRVLADRTVKARRRSFEALLVWACGLGDDLVWAIGGLPARFRGAGALPARAWRVTCSPAALTG
jgi:hypothetical protein